MFDVLVFGTAVEWCIEMRASRRSSRSVPGGTGDVGAATHASHSPIPPTPRRALRLGLALATAINLIGIRRLRRLAAAAIADRDEALRQVELLGDVARELNSTLDPRQVLETAVRLAAEIASPPGSQARRANYCRISGDTVRVDAEFDASGYYIGASWPISEHPLLARAVHDRQPTSGALDPATLGPRVRELAAEQRVGYGAWVPVSVNGELHGVLAVAGRNRAVSESEVARCVAIVRILELALENALAHEHSQQAARTDPLTAVANRRGMELQVAERRGRRPLTVLAIDIDNLKGVNDGYGHGAGDRLLVHVAGVIGSTSRMGDVVARVGGDEFVSVLFDADSTDGVRVADRILALLAHAFDCRFSPRVSIGIADAAAGEQLASVVRRADAAMYEAKRAGGMRYIVAGADQSLDTPASHPAPAAASDSPALCDDGGCS